MAFRKQTDGFNIFKRRGDLRRGCEGEYIHICMYIYIQVYTPLGQSIMPWPVAPCFLPLPGYQSSGWKQTTICCLWHFRNPGGWQCLLQYSSLPHFCNWLKVQGFKTHILEGSSLGLWFHAPLVWNAKNRTSKPTMTFSYCAIITSVTHIGTAEAGN